MTPRFCTPADRPLQRHAQRTQQCSVLSNPPGAISGAYWQIVRFCLSISVSPPPPPTLHFLFIRFLCLVFVPCFAFKRTSTWLRKSIRGMYSKYPTKPRPTSVRICSCRYLLLTVYQNASIKFFFWPRPYTPKLNATTTTTHHRRTEQSTDCTNYASKF